MTWQDWVFSVGGLFVLVGLVPTIRGEQKPALATSLLTTTLVAIFAATMASMSLWLSALTNALISAVWGILAVQRYRQDIDNNTPLREELLDLSAGSEGGS